MGIRKKRQFCEEDMEWVLGEKNTPNHLLHLVMSIVTVGFWVPVWILIAGIGGGSYQCPKCGSKTLGYMPKKYKQAVAKKKIETLS